MPIFYHLAHGLDVSVVRGVVEGSKYWKEKMKVVLLQRRNRVRRLWVVEFAASAKTPPGNDAGGF
jgi:hypothetical protein